MPQPDSDPALVGFALATLALSALTGVCLLCLRERGPLLPYEPRRPVPWTAIGALLVILFLSNAFAALSLHEPSAAEPKASTPEQANMLVVQAASELVLVAGFVVVIALFFKATRHDLGLPADATVARRDVRIGIVAGLAALAPVIITQATLNYLIYGHEKSSGQPLIKMLMSGEKSEILLILMAVVAVVVAPICEEVAFRMLMQGWLEKWEDARLGWRVPTIPLAVTIDESRTTNDDENQAESELIINDDSSLELTPPRHGIAGLPYGWFPVIVSAMLFGLAHIGYGPEPIPLFFLGLVLGYVYQRTHRIIPGIVTHALFNLFTVIILWRMMYHNG
jgi:membrane protease YdiL (CAAX protease family)